MKLFLSYPHKDTDKAKDLVKILTDGGQEVWLDEHLRIGPSWKDQLAENIRAADAIVLALTPAWLASPYCQWEFITAAEQGKQVIPVLLANQPDGERLTVPNRISQYQWADFSAGFGNPEKVQKFLNDLLALGVTLKASDVADRDKEAYAMSIEEENKKSNHTTITGGQQGAVNNYGSQTNNFGPQTNTNQTTQSGNNISVSGSNNTVAGRDVNQNQHTKNINIGGNVQGGNVNFGEQTVHGDMHITMRDLTQTIQQGSAPLSDKEQLQQLVDKLREALQAVPEEQKANAEKIAKRTEELVTEVSTDELDKDGVDSKVNLLQKAAENIQGALPAVFAIAMSIVGFGRQMAGL